MEVKSCSEKVQQTTKINEEEDELLEFMEEEEEEQQLEIVAPRGQISSGILTSEQNKIRVNIMKKKLVYKGQLLHLPITSI